MLDGTRLLAAASWFLSDGSDQFPRSSVLSWFVGYSDTALDKLLAEFARQSAAHRSSQIEICPRNGLGVGWFCIPDVWLHLNLALQRFGCISQDKWVIMYAVSRVQALPELPEFTFQWNIKELQLEWELTAHANETLVGDCFAWGIPAHFRGCHDYDAWITFEWVGVEEPYRRRGLARRLMAEQMQFHARHGVRNFMLWVEVENVAARTLYESLGFRNGPVCATYEKEVT